MKRNISKKTKISKNKNINNNTKKYKTQRGGSKAPSSRLSLSADAKPYSILNNAKKQQIDDIIKEYNSFMKLIDNNIQIIYQFEQTGYQLIDIEHLQKIISSFAFLRKGISKIETTMNDLYKVSMRYTVSEARMQTSVINNITEMETFLKNLLTYAELNLANQYNDYVINQYANSKYGINLESAYQAKAASGKTTETYENFINALIIFYQIIYMSEFTKILNDPTTKNKKINFIDSENILQMHLHLPTASISRSDLYEKLTRVIVNYSNTNPDENIFILVNRGDISSDNDIFGTFNNNFYYVNAKCAVMQTCESDDFLLIMLLKYFEDKGYNCSIMSHDNYRWLTKDRTRTTFNISNPKHISMRNSKSNHVNRSNIQRNVQKFSHSLNTVT